MISLKNKITTLFSDDPSKYKNKDLENFKISLGKLEAQNDIDFLERTADLTFCIIKFSIT
jgi:hypothetical protein